MPWTYVSSNFTGEEIVEKELEKTNQIGFAVENVIKREGDKLCVKWKGFDISFDNWIDKKDIV